MKLALFLIVSLIFSCRGTEMKKRTSRTLEVEFETSHVCSGGYILIDGGYFFHNKGSILKDTCNTPFTGFIRSAKSNYIPNISAISKLEQKLEGRKLKRYYRLYSGFITHENDTIIEIVAIEPFDAKRRKSWKSERWQVSASPPFPQRGEKNKKQTIFYFDLTKDDFLESNQVVKYELDR
jgi:hypothetical protein